MHRQLFQHVCDVLDQAGFRERDGTRGLIVTPTEQGVRVDWSPSLRRMDDCGSIRTALVTAVATVLEQAGFGVQNQDEYLLVTPQGAVSVGAARP